MVKYATQQKINKEMMKMQACLNFYNHTEKSLNSVTCFTTKVKLFLIFFFKINSTKYLIKAT